ncbi:hypothetical protein [uncultured Ilyobacter sp.]|uniref:hypothetical protein n=1 Tax=uncultured Ilyobacter sp. TaxID=544433 RepID=UPI002AA66B2D|nr:hypothetical protein [uncultured Ilyobacter sp.]
MLHEKQYRPTTINVRLRTLKAYFHWLYNDGYIDDKLYKGIKKANENPCGSVTTFTKRRYKKNAQSSELEFIQWIQRLFIDVTNAGYRY